LELDVRSQIFGVEHEGTGKTGWCMVLGAARELFGLVVYRGDDALKSTERMARGNMYDDDFIYVQDVLMVSFEPKRKLTKRDRLVLDRFPVRFRGKWPQFQSFLPGHPPWHVNRDEASYLCSVLRGAMTVALEVRKDPGFLDVEPDGKRWVFVKKKAKGVESWTLEKRLPQPPKARPDAPPVNEVEVERIRQSFEKSHQILECDWFYMPAAIHEGPRPYYPRIMLAVDTGTGMLLEPHLSKTDDSTQFVRASFLDTIRSLRAVPTRVCVVKTEAHAALLPIANMLGIRLDCVKSMPSLEPAKQGLFSRLR
jgi:hypothetical protein